MFDPEVAEINEFFIIDAWCPKNKSDLYIQGYEGKNDVVVVDVNFSKMNCTD